MVAYLLTGPSTAWMGVDRLESLLFLWAERLAMGLILWIALGDYYYYLPV